MFIPLLVIGMISCETSDETEVITVYGGEIELRNAYPDEDLEKIEAVLTHFYGFDTTTLQVKVDTMEAKLARNAYTNVYQMYAEFGVSTSEVDSLPWLDSNDIIPDSSETYEVTPEFLLAYTDWIENDSSIIFEWVNNEIELRSIRGWFKDPCGLGAVVTMTGWNAVLMISACAGAGAAPVTGGASLIGTGTAIVGIVNEIKSFVDDCL